MTSANVDDLFYFVLPISAALGFKNFSNAVLRAKCLPTPALALTFITSSAVQCDAS